MKEERERSLFSLGNGERKTSAFLREREMGLDGRAASSSATSRLAVERGRDKGRGKERSAALWID